MSAVLETIPEFNSSELAARESLPNFSFDEMSAMIERDFIDPNKRIIVATQDGEIAGQALYSLKRDENNLAYGFCFSAYVTPPFRRKGLGRTLMNDAMSWFKTNQVSYVLAQTHVTNTAVLELGKQLGFMMEGPHQGAWKYYTLRYDVAR
jgi:L-amino acid N-acyltransferase YncA